MKQKSYPLSYVTKLLFLGFFFQFVHLDMWYFAYLMQAVSLLLLWQGMWILKDVNENFHSASHAATAFLMIGGASLIFQAVPGFFVHLSEGLNIIVLIILLNFYGLGMKQWLLSLDTEASVKSKRIVIEYLIILVLLFFSSLSASFASINIWICLLLYIVMIVQIFHVHKQMKQRLPAYKVETTGIPCGRVAACFLIVLLVGIPSACYLIAQQESLDDISWITHQREERAELIEKGLPEKLANDISDDVVEEISEVKQFQKMENNNMGELDVEQYIGISGTDRVHYLAYIRLAEKRMPGNIAMKFDEDTQGDLATHEIAVLYDENKETRGYKSFTGFDFQLKHGTNQRQYLYAAGTATETLIPAMIEFYYQSTWFQYPYQGSITNYISNPNFKPYGELREDLRYQQNYVTIDMDELQK